MRLLSLVTVLLLAISSGLNAAAITGSSDSATGNYSSCETYTNYGSDSWIGFTLTLDSDGAFVESSITVAGDVFTVTSFSDTEIVFGSGVLSQYETLQFCYTIGDVPLTSYGTTSRPDVVFTPMVPEPATVSILAFGALGLARRRFC